MDRSTRQALADEIRALGERATPARLQVLQQLREAERAMTHAEIEASLQGAAGDRVTLYRTFDWLVDKGLAHRATDEHRVARYSASSGKQLAHTGHAHFLCDDCGKVYCLDRVAPTRPRLPNGFRARDVALSVRGSCSACNATR
ncbi:MAG TPA: transcriptional repressor [Burkholderiales bacterium]|jgi:Fe2+/Zn2+ uptake regulation proteins